MSALMTDVRCSRMVYEADDSRHECVRPATHVVTIHGVDGEGRPLEGVFPPCAMCEPCALKVEPMADDSSILVRPLAWMRGEGK